MRIKGSPHARCHLVADPSAAVTLTDLDRARLHSVAHRDQSNARTRVRAEVLLKLGAGWSEAKIEEAFDVCRDTVKRLHVRFLAGGVDAVLTDKVQERRRQALTGAPSLTSRRRCAGWRKSVMPTWSTCAWCPTTSTPTGRPPSTKRSRPSKRGPLQRVEFRYTPKHNSWLNMTEIESSVVERGGLSRPVGDRQTLEQRMAELEAERNATAALSIGSSPPNRRASSWRTTI